MWKPQFSAPAPVPPNPPPIPIATESTPETPLVFFIIYSCRKNMHKAKQIYELVKDKIPTFTPLILYGDPKLKEAYQVKTPFLVVKSGDAYEHLSQKTMAMIHAINELSYYENYRGVIKCDDDILPNLASLQRFYEQLISSKTNIPYAGNLYYVDNDEKVSSSHFNKCSSPKYNIQQPILSDCLYATGPMYYLSIPSAILLERKYETKKFDMYFYEDMMVAANLNKHGIFPIKYPFYQNEFTCAFQSPSIQNINEKTRLLYVLLHGGLGNQMFQVASGYGLARASGRYLVALYTPNKSQYPHQSAMLEYTHTIFQNTPSMMITQELIQSPSVELYSEIGDISKGFQYHPDILNPEKDMLISGYFQNEEYFRAYRNELLEEWKNPLLAKTLIETYTNLPHSYFFHVRRGDYVDNPLYVIDWDNYYSRALDTILEHEENSENIQFYVFSNDNEFCKSYRVFNDYLKEYPQITFTLIENLGAIESLYFMSQCGKGGICANSSFSWWGGYLNPREDKMVILPNQWVNLPEEDSSPFSVMNFEGAILL